MVITNIKMEGCIQIELESHNIMCTYIFDTLMHENMDEIGVIALLMRVPLLEAAGRTVGRLQKIWYC